MKLVAALACRNNSTRLYGKPLQLLGKDSVLEYIIKRLEKTPEIHSIVLAISETKGNEAFIEYAEKRGLPYVIGSDKDVLDRLIKATKLVNGDTVFRMTTESPFPYLEGISEAVRSHQEKEADYTAFGQLLDGGVFEIIKLEALERSHRDGQSKHRSEYCTLYINENPNLFKINVLYPPEKHQRPDYRLTIDFPEDLILCRKIVAHFGADEIVSYDKLITFLDAHPELTSSVQGLTDASYIKFFY